MTNEYDVVFSGRTFVDGRGLSNMSGSSPLAAVVQDDSVLVSTPAQIRKRRRERARRRNQLARGQSSAVIAAQLDTDEPIDRPAPRCRCGCGAIVPQRTYGGGRPKLYVSRLHQSRDWQRSYARPTPRPTKSTTSVRMAPPLPHGRTFGRGTAAAA